MQNIAHFLLFLEFYAGMATSGINSASCCFHSDYRFIVEDFSGVPEFGPQRAYLFAGKIFHGFLPEVEICLYLHRPITRLPLENPTNPNHKKCH